MGPGKGETFDPWASGRKGEECPEKIRTEEFMFMLFFFSETSVHQNQRAENGASDPLSLDLRLGRPRFLPQIAPKPFKIRVLGPLD